MQTAQALSHATPQVKKTPAFATLRTVMFTSSSMTATATAQMMQILH